MTRATTYEIFLPVQSGSEQLKAWIEKRFDSQREAVDYLGIPGIDEVVLSKILNAGRRPELEKLAIIEEKTGIPLRAWVTSSQDESETVAAASPRKRK